MVSVQGLGSLSAGKKDFRLVLLMARLRKLTAPCSIGDLKSGELQDLSPKTMLSYLKILAQVQSKDSLLRELVSKPYEEQTYKVLDNDRQEECARKVYLYICNCVEKDAWCKVDVERFNQLYVENDSQYLANLGYAMCVFEYLTYNR